MKSFIPYLILVFLGVGWGITQPLSKLAVSTGHEHFGLIFWQFVLGAMVLGIIQFARGRPLTRSKTAFLFYAIIAVIGTLAPNSASYQAIAHLPSGLVSILLSLVPMLAFPIALLLGNDTFKWRSLLGLVFGLVAVLLIVGLPDALPPGAVMIFVPVALIAPLFYAFEGNFVSKWGTGGTGPIELLFGASVVGAFLTLPLAIASDQFINPIRAYGIAEIALISSSVIHAVVYATYVGLVRAYGPVFAVQVSYLVTAAGVLWAMALLGERYGGSIWWAVVLMMIGIYLVSPKSQNSDHDPIS